MTNPARFYCTRKLEFDAAHRVLQHESKCKHLHGHRYVLEVTVSAPRLDSLARVVDFGVIKSILGGWVDANWDHNILLNSQDPLLAYAAKLEVMWATANTVDGSVPDDNSSPVDQLFAGKRPYLFQDLNPTAETIATVFLGIANDLLKADYSNLNVEQVRVYETPNCWSDAYCETMQPTVPKKNLRTMRSE